MALQKWWVVQHNPDRTLIIFTDGKYKAPSIEKIAVINETDKDSQNDYKEGIDGFESYFSLEGDVGEDYFEQAPFTIYRRKDFSEFSELKERRRKGRLGRDGSESDTGSENGRGDSNKTRTEGSGKISYASRDSEYMDAVSSDNMTAAERMVREAAKDIPTIAKDKRGFPLHLYHGTPEFGFTEFA